jgi:hypothetical protein
MLFLLRSELLAVFVSPFLLAILRRRGAVTDKQIEITIATLLSLFFTSYYLSLGNPETFFSITLKDWSVAIVLSFLSWVCGYLSVRWVFKEWSQK